MSDPAPSPAPPPPPHFSSGYFRDASVADRRRHLGRGLVGHVPIVAMLMIGLGVLEGALALLFVMFALVSSVLPPESGANPVMLAILYSGLAVFTLSCAVIRLLAGLSVLRFRRRKLGLAALGLGLLTVFTGLCAPTAIGLAVYGLIVLFNDPVIAAFELGEAGQTADQIQAAFPPGG
jgi:hypothetical protein